jgi:hypothetical protein
MIDYNFINNSIGQIAKIARAHRIPRGWRVLDIWEGIQIKY